MGPGAPGLLPHCQAAMNMASLKVAHWNAGGQVQDTDELFSMNHNILAFTETWDFKEGDRKFCGREGYHLFTSCRSIPPTQKSGRPHGGIALYIHKSICGDSYPVIHHHQADKGILSVASHYSILLLLSAIFLHMGHAVMISGTLMMTLSST